MSSVLDQLREEESRARDAAVAAVAAFNELAAKMAAGAEPKLAQVQAVLTAAGKDADDLDAAISNRRRRSAEIARMRRGEEAAGERREAQAKIEAIAEQLRRETEARQAEVQAEIEQLQNKIAALVNEIQQGAAAKRTLQTDLRDPVLNSRLVANQKSMDCLQVKIMCTQKITSELCDALKSEERRKGDPAKIAQQKKGLETNYAKLAEHDAEMGRLLNEQAEIMAAMLEE